MLYLPNVQAIQYNKLGMERLTQLGNSNILRLPVQDHCKEFRRLYRVLSSCFPNYRKGGEGKEKKKMENEEGKINDKII